VQCQTEIGLRFLIMLGNFLLWLYKDEVENDD
jgi:hypothetical protein